jgi:CRP/FNR family cyclic AMP-dependent transcriptional regulator
MADHLQLLETVGAEGACPGDLENWRLKTSERSALSDNSWFAGLPSAIRHDLLRSLRVRSFAPGATIYTTGTPIRAWMVCLAGAVRVGTSFSAGGRSLILGFLRPGQWFGDFPVPGQTSHTHEASATHATRVGEVDRHTVFALMEKYPEFHAALLEWQSMRLASVYRLLEEHATLDLSARMARHLHRLGKDHGTPHGGGGVRIGLPLLQSDLAALVGCSRQRANEAVGELTRRQLLRYEKGKLVLTDRRALERLLGQDAA